MEQLIDQPISLGAVIDFLVASPLFRDLDAEERADVVRIMEIQRLQKGEEVFHEGDAGDSWYVIYEGQVEVTTASSSGDERPLSVLDMGSGFGEMAMLDGSPRSATVRATGPLTLFRFRRPRFEELLGDGSLGAYKLVLAMARGNVASAAAPDIAGCGDDGKCLRRLRPGAGTGVGVDRAVPDLRVGPA